MYFKSRHGMEYIHKDNKNNEKYNCRYMWDIVKSVCLYKSMFLCREWPTLGIEGMFPITNQCLAYRFILLGIASSRHDILVCNKPKMIIIPNININKVVIKPNLR